MADFRKVIPFTLTYEGGYCNDPGDSGGPTSWGISLYTVRRKKGDLKLLDINKDGKFTHADIRLMTKEKATFIYYNNYWRDMDLDEVISDKAAFVIFDAMVNHGLSGCTKLLQRTCNAMGANLKVDGVFGPLTKNAMLTYTLDDDEFCRIFNEKREDYYYAIVKQKPSQKKFLKGWINRLTKVKRDMQKL